LANIGFTRIKFTKASRKHKIGKAHVLHLMQTEPTRGVRPTGELELSWQGPDDRGVDLEVTAAVTPDGLVLVLHVMPTALRRK
jgi:hypothetical protein